MSRCIKPTQYEICCKNFVADVEPRENYVAKTHFAQKKKQKNVVIRLFGKKNFEIRIFSQIFDIRFIRANLLSKTEETRLKRVKLEKKNPPKTKLVLIKMLCEEQIRINHHFAIHFRKSVKFSRIYKDFMLICLKSTFFTSKIMYNYIILHPFSTQSDLLRF